VSPRKTKDLQNPAPNRVFFLLLLALLPALALARPQPKFVGGGKPDPAEGKRVLEEFRHVGVQGPYWMQFELREMPRRGPERMIQGQMYGMQGEQGPLTHVVFTDPANTGGDQTVHFLLEGGDSPKAWEWNAGAKGATAKALPADQLLAPVHGTDLTIFDLQMPFLRWTDHVYEGLAKVRGRPAHAFILYPPSPLSAPANAQGVAVPAAIRVFLDTQFGAMTQAEWLDDKGGSIKTVTVLDLKKSNEQWIVKSIDLRNHVSRAKTRFAVTAVALGLDLPRRLFDPQHVAEPLPEIPAGKRERF
jgi:hypothetical protein